MKSHPLGWLFSSPIVQIDTNIDQILKIDKWKKLNLKIPLTFISGFFRIKIFRLFTYNSYLIFSKLKAIRPYITEDELYHL